MKCLCDRNVGGISNIIIINLPSAKINFVKRKTNDCADKVGLGGFVQGSLLFLVWNCLFVSSTNRIMFICSCSYVESLNDLTGKVRSSRDFLFGESVDCGVPQKWAQFMLTI